MELTCFARSAQCCSDLRLLPSSGNLLRHAERLLLISPRPLLPANWLLRIPQGLLRAAQRWLPVCRRLLMDTERLLPVAPRLLRPAKRPLQAEPTAYQQSLLHRRDLPLDCSAEALPMGLGHSSGGKKRNAFGPTFEGGINSLG